MMLVGRKKEVKKMAEKKTWKINGQVIKLQRGWNVGGFLKNALMYKNGEKILQDMKNPRKFISRIFKQQAGPDPTPGYFMMERVFPGVVHIPSKKAYFDGRCAYFYKTGVMRIAPVRVPIYKESEKLKDSITSGYEKLEESGLTPLDIMITMRMAANEFDRIHKGRQDDEFEFSLDDLDEIIEIDKMEE